MLDPAPRPDLRRTPRRVTSVYRIHVDLDQAEPPIWRRLDLRSDLTLDVVHLALQAAFDWEDYHLHRFSIGGKPFDRESQLFLCPYDVAENDFHTKGLPATDVRLDETMQEPGDTLNYLYDYGDSWELTLKLEEILPADPATPPATAVAGDRAAPPEDSGGMTDAQSLAEVLEDPARFELAELEAALRTPYLRLVTEPTAPRLLDLARQFRGTSIADDVCERALAVQSNPETEPADLATALSAYQWFLDRAHGAGIPLTQAGYLKPADVEEATRILPTAARFIGIGANDREVNTPFLLSFRESLQHLGLLRKFKGKLVLTRAGTAAQQDSTKLWRHVADRLIPSRSDFEALATPLFLLYAATNDGSPLPLPALASAITELGWGRSDDSPVQEFDLFRLEVRTLLANIIDPTTPSELNLGASFGPAPAALARAALQISSKS